MHVAVPQYPAAHVATVVVVAVAVAVSDAVAVADIVPVAVSVDVAVALPVAEDDEVELDVSVCVPTGPADVDDVPVAVAVDVAVAVAVLVAVAVELDVALVVRVARALAALCDATELAEGDTVAGGDTDSTSGRVADADTVGVGEGVIEDVVASEHAAFSAELDVFGHPRGPCTSVALPLHVLEGGGGACSKSAHVGGALHVRTRGRGAHTHAEADHSEIVATPPPHVTRHEAVALSWKHAFVP